MNKEGDDTISIKIKSVNNRISKSDIFSTDNRNKRKDRDEDIEQYKSYKIQKKKEIQSTKDHFVILINNSFSQIPPWVISQKEEEYTLSKEIEQFVNYIEMPPHEKRVRQDLIDRVTVIIQNLYPNSKCHVFGSFYTDLALPYSDIDIVVLGLPPTNDVLRRVADELFVRRMSVRKPNIIRAKVSLVKFSDSFTGIDVDISFNEEGGLLNSRLIQSYIGKFEYARKLILTIKYFIHIRGASNVAQGGLGSYAITLMVISFLQNHPSVNIETGKSSDCLGNLLIDFFCLYGRTFNYYNTGIRVKSCNYFPKYKGEEDIDLKNSYLLSIEDPNNQDNDVCKQTSQISLIRKYFFFAYNIITREHDVEDAPTLLSRIIKPDPNIEQMREAFLVMDELICKKKLYHKMDDIKKDKRKD